ncbi:subtilisin family serine protease [Planomicrobium soli]|uniref:Subtilisin family serine protease n=1 Tax=Planomicrobium soli TaxID=1176648 RepID=A0A2P8H3M7_9BACL|nr:S8 family serine peptidase [Planomicrobium soli]PSL40800.1 subtilisin family serine protease [Planomicrobium soli]
MKKTLVTLFVILISIFPFHGSITYAEGDEQNLSAIPEPTQVIVHLEEDAASKLAESEAVITNTEDAEQLVTIEVPQDESIEAFMKDLENRKDVASVEPDYFVKLDYVANDPDLVSFQYHHKAIESSAAWDITLGSPDVVVAVIDDGVDLNHVDLKNQIISHYNMVEGKKFTKGEHGTHVAGIIAGVLNNNTGGAGVAPNTKIMAIDVFDGDFALISDIIKGIHQAVDSGAHIINMSLGSYSTSTALEKAIQHAHSKGVVVVAAAGNDFTSKNHYPAAYQEVISVASTTSVNRQSSFSNYGSTIDIAAPGTEIFSTLPNNSYGWMSGTSMATPVVAGIAALLKANEPALTNKQIADRLFLTAKDLGVKGKDTKFGNGLVNAKNALKNIDKTVPVVPTVNTITDSTTSITGKTELNARVIAYEGNTKLGEAIAKNGTYTMKIAMQKAGTSISLYAIDAAKNKSATRTVTVIDKTPPAIPAVNTVSNKSTTVTGKAESNAKVYVYAGKTKLGEATAKNGVYSITIAKQKAGTILSVYAIDAAKNRSGTRNVKVIDKIAPSIPTVNSITSKSTMVSGKAEKGAVITVYIGTKKLGQGTVNSEGSFKVSISAPKKGAVIKVYATDKAGNKSGSRTITVK